MHCALENTISFQTLKTIFKQSTCDRIPGLNIDMLSMSSYNKEKSSLTDRPDRIDIS